MNQPHWRDSMCVSYGTVDGMALEEQPRRRRCDVCAGADQCCLPSDTASVWRNVAFLTVQGLVAWWAGVALLIAATACFVLLPLCGLGYYFFCLLFRCGVIDFVAKCEAAMINYVVPAGDQIQIDSPVDGNSQCDPTAQVPRDYGPPEQLIGGLRELSIESCMVLIYMTTLRLLLSTVGLLMVLTVIGAPLLLLTNTLFNTHLLVGIDASAWEAVCIYTTLVLVFLVAIMSLDLLVTLWSATTRFFCCERVYTLPLPRPRVVSTATARPNVIVVRIPPSATEVYAFASSAGSTAATS